jgi:hypothetical protein
MHVERTGSWPPVQPSALKRCPACGEARPLADFSAAPAARSASASASASCRACRRAAARLASRRRAAAMRLLVALHPREWAGLLALVGGRRQPATARPRGGGYDG